MSRAQLERIARGEPAVSPTAQDLVGDTPAVRGQNDRDNATVRSRQRGVFNGTNLKLQILTEIPGYDLRWFNDTPGRLLQAQQGGWEFVTHEEVSQPEGNKVVGRNSTDSRVSAIAGVMDNNAPLNNFLMKIKKEWRDEDQADALKKIDDTEAQMVRGQGMNADRIGPTYLPDDKKRALEIKRGEFNRP